MKFFKSIYVKVVQWLATCLVKWANSTLLHLIVLKGKDPNCVALPILSKPITNYPVVDSEKIERTIRKFHSRPRPTWLADVSQPNWVKDIGQHPILQARQAFESQSREVAAVSGHAIDSHADKLSSDEFSEMTKPLVNSSESK